jgi:hypothetical protein
MEQLISVKDRMCFMNDRDDLKMSEMYKCEGLFADFIRKFKSGYGRMKSNELYGFYLGFNRN